MQNSELYGNFLFLVRFAIFLLTNVYLDVF